MYGILPPLSFPIPERTADDGVIEAMRLEAARSFKPPVDPFEEIKARRGNRRCTGNAL